MERGRNLSEGLGALASLALIVVYTGLYLSRPSSKSYDHNPQTVERTSTSQPASDITIHCQHCLKDIKLVEFHDHTFYRECPKLASKAQPTQTHP